MTKPGVEPSPESWGLLHITISTVVGLGVFASVDFAVKRGLIDSTDAPLGIVMLALLVVVVLSLQYVFASA